MLTRAIAALNIKLPNAKLSFCPLNYLKFIKHVTVF